MVKVVIGSDHAGFSLKEKLKGQSSVDLIDRSESLHLGDDYPDVAFMVCEEVVRSRGARGVLVCGSGMGMSIAANKVAGVRAALCREVGDAIMARRDNDANVLCLGGRVTSASVARDILSAFLATPFAGSVPGGSAHKRRVKKLKYFDVNC